MKHLARTLRKNMTDAERRLWSHLRNRRLGGYKFRRQKPIGPFIADFVCAKQKLIIEIDGGQHAVNTEADNRRTEYLKRNGWKLLRFWNHEVEGTGGCLSSDFGCLRALSPRPSPQRGEGETHARVTQNRRRNVFRGRKRERPLISGKGGTYHSIPPHRRKSWNLIPSPLRGEG